MLLRAKWLLLYLTFLCNNDDGFRKFLTLRRLPRALVITAQAGMTPESKRPLITPVIFI